MDPEIVIVLAASIFIFLLLLFLFNFIYKYQKRTISFIKEKQMLQSRFEQVLLQSQIEVQESTYRQIAKELHDNVGQLLSTTKMLMGVTEIKLETVPDTLRTANATLSKAIHEIRSLSRSLDREWLQQFNFMENLSDEVNRINAGETVKSIIHSNITINMKPEEQIILFRIVQEAMQNAIKHAQPSNLRIVIYSNENMVVEITNDGKELPADFHGMGTNNMRYRTELLGGNIEWKANTTETNVVVRLPLKYTHEN